MMKEIIALKEYTDKYISLYEGEIRNIADDLADRLITQGVVAEHSDDSSSDGSVSGGLIVNETVANGVHMLDKTWKQIRDAMANGQTVMISHPDFYPSSEDFQSDVYVDDNMFEIVSYVKRGATYTGDVLTEAYYDVMSAYSGNGYQTNTENGYPSFVEQDH